MAWFLYVLSTTDFPQITEYSAALRNQAKSGLFNILLQYLKPWHSRVMTAPKKEQRHKVIGLSSKPRLSEMKMNQHKREKPIQTHSILVSLQIFVYSQYTPHTHTPRALDSIDQTINTKIYQVTILYSNIQSKILPLLSQQEICYCL